MLHEPDVEDLRARIAQQREAYAQARSRGDVPAADLALARLNHLVENAVETLAPRAPDPLRMVL
ncbi:MAG: hypothetical protein U0Q15_17975 [Kineosporiaceae bacterium]